MFVYICEQIDGSDPVEISPSEPVTLIPGQVWIFQKTEYIIDKVSVK